MEFEFKGIQMGLNKEIPMGFKYKISNRNLKEV